MATEPAVKFVKYDTSFSREVAEDAARVTSAIVEALAQKGFCVINAKSAVEALEETGDVLKLAENEIKDLDSQDRFEVPPREIVLGLLGEEGSARIYEIETSSDSDAPDGVNLSKLDSIMTSLATLLSPVAETRLSSPFTGRTRALLHMTGESDESPPELTEYSADLWASYFLNSRFLILLFLGPGRAHLELQPRFQEEAKAYMVSTEPGMVVILRSDTLSHNFNSYQPSSVMSCWLVQQACSESEAFVKDVDLQVAHPVARELLQWIWNRMRDLKLQEAVGEEGQEWDPAIPRTWQTAMNHMYTRGPQVAVRGTSARLAVTWDTHPFWCGLSYGSDLAQKVPMNRWNHDENYDENLNSWKWGKSYARHGVFIDGADLFDNKPFGLAVYECKGMDPCQRVILETGYEALRDAGLTKKSMMRSLIGVYAGLSITEFGCVPVTADIVGTSCSGAITSNRISFCLGLQGPSLSIDVGGAAMHAALSQAYNSIRFQTPQYKPNHTAMACCINLCLAPNYFVINCAAGLLSAGGRCFTFDTTASGYVRGEGCGAVVVDASVEVVDGQAVKDDAKESHGNLAAVMMSHCGQAASLSAPNGPQERRLINDTLRQAPLSPLDVDALECWGEAGILSDAVEAASAVSSYRGDETRIPFGMSSVKSGLGFMHESSGAAQFLKLLYTNRFGTQVPGLHIMELNPHVEAWDDTPLQFHQENLHFKDMSSFYGFGGRSQSGTMAHGILWGEVDQRVCVPLQRVRREGIAFWPGGGGDLDPGAEARHHYAIVGSWTQYEAAEPMEKEEEGVYGFTVTLGVNRFEHFQICLDGNPEKVLHAGVQNAPKNLPVVGPESGAMSGGFYWMIDGRRGYHTVALPRRRPKDGVLALENDDGAAATRHDESATDEDLVYVQDDCQEVGNPGDSFRVRLFVAGKWRTVDWMKIEPDPGDEAVAVEDSATYYVVANWNDWSFTQPMSQDKGSHSLEVALDRGNGEFQIVRSQDWHQAFFPPSADSAALGGLAEGPDWCADGLVWTISCREAKSFRILFQRGLQADDDRGAPSVSWVPLS